MKSIRLKPMALMALVVLCGADAARADWVTVSSSGSPVLTTCNPKPFTTPTPSTCLLTGNTLPAAMGTGYILRSSTSANITVNSVVVGVLYDRVYCLGVGTSCTTSGAGANTYVLATRIHLNGSTWNGHNTDSFEVNDTIRAIKSTVSVADIAYWMGPDSGGSTTSTDPDLALADMKWLEYSGRTQYGLNDAMVGTRDDNYIDHRQDVNANDPDGVSSQWSAWLLVRQVCPSGVPTTRPSFTIKLWEGGEEAQDHYTQWMAGYKCS